MAGQMPILRAEEKAADERRFKHEDVTREVIKVLFDVYNDLGYGFVESIYQEAMALTLASEGFHVERELSLEIHFRGKPSASDQTACLLNLRKRAMSSPPPSTSICVHLR